MTMETQLRWDIADHAIKAKNAKAVLDINSTALALSRKYIGSELSVQDIRKELERAAVAQGAPILCDHPKSQN